MPATPYTGVPTNVQPPSSAPGPGVAPSGNIPAGTDQLSIESITQDMKVDKDFIAYVQKAARWTNPHVQAAASAFTAVTQTGGGSGTVTPSASPSPLYYVWVIQIQTGGAVGTATFKTSIDGGNTYGALQTTAASMTDATTGITLAFASTFNASTTYAFTNAILPLASWLNGAGNGRWLVDHNGFPMGGRISEVSEEWDFSAGALGAGAIAGTRWTTALAAGSAVSLQSPTANYNARFAQFTPSSTGSLQTLLYSYPFFLANTPAMSLRLDMEFGISVGGAATNVSWYWGFGAGTNPLADNSILAFYKDNVGTNYSVITGTGIARTLSLTSIAPTLGVYPTDRFTIEIQGSASPLGAYQAFFYINDAYVFNTSSLPGATAMRFMFGSSNDGGAPSGSPVGSLGKVKMCWNRYATISL
jgi:hypothetical protein